MAPKTPTFAPKPFTLNPLVTLEDAGVETQRVAQAVAAGTLDHDTGAFLVNAIRVFMDSLAVLRAEAEDAKSEALLNAAVQPNRSFEP
jgi:hypothetical protein